MSDRMAEPPPEFIPPTPPVTQAPASAFVWWGLACLVAALSLGIGTALGAQGAAGGWARNGLAISVALVVAGAGLFIAQARYTFWRRTAGIVALAPAPGERDAREMPDASELALRQMDFLLGLCMALLAAILRLAPLLQSLSARELQFIAALNGGPAPASPGFSPPLNTWLVSLCLRAHTALAGARAELPPAWIVRLPAFLFGVFAAWALYAAARRHMERMAAVGAAALLALSPAAIDLSTQAHGSSALLFFAIVLSYWLTPALRTSSAAAWMWWLACAVLGVLAHPYFVFVLVVNLIFIIALAVWVYRSLLDPPRARALVEQAITLTIVWMPLALSGYLSLWPAAPKPGTLAVVPETALRAHAIVVPLLQSWGGVPQGALWTVFWIASLILILLGIRHLVRNVSSSALYLPLMLVVPPLLAEILQLRLATLANFSFLLPAFLTLVACGLWHLALWTLGPRPERAVYQALAFSVGAAGFVMLTLSGLWQVLLLPRQGYEGAAQWLLGQSTSGRAIVSVGAGGEFLDRYGLTVEHPANAAKLRALLKSSKTLFVVDMGRQENPGVPPSDLPAFIEHAAKQTVKVFPGRYAYWPYRSLDDDSDITIYRLERR
ncbi:MAG TPA: glycosyltransferase family 39 protein [Chthonomonadaceae bacterium]|nr:glycosyltransferase family 39 protein [Chthonomonadaceae bacterium]